MSLVKYEIKLSEQEKEELLHIVEEERHPFCTRAKILLLLDKRSDTHMKISEIAKACLVSYMTVRNVRKSYCENGLETAIYRVYAKPPRIQQRVECKIPCTRLLEILTDYIDADRRYHTFAAILRQLRKKCSCTEEEIKQLGLNDYDQHTQLKPYVYYDPEIEKNL